MSAEDSFRRLVGVALFAALILIMAVVSPLLVSAWLDTSQVTTVTTPTSAPEGSLLACLFLPTQADWPSHLLSYALAALLASGGCSGVVSLVRQLHRTSHFTRTLLQVSRFSGEQPYECDQPGGQRAWQEILNDLTLQGRVDLVPLAQPLAFCYGWLKPRICLSTGALEGLSNQEVEALLLHERYHLLRRDPVRAVISRVLASTFFFLPLLRALDRQYLVAREIEADLHVLSVQGSDRPLLSVLYKLLIRERTGEACGANRISSGASGAAGIAGIAGAVGPAGGADSLNQRLDYLLNGRRPLYAHPRLHSSSLALSSAMIAAMGAMLLFTAWAAAANALWHQAHTTIGGC